MKAQNEKGIDGPNFFLDRKNAKYVGGFSIASDIIVSRQESNSGVITSVDVKARGGIFCHYEGKYEGGNSISGSRSDGGEGDLRKFHTSWQIELPR